MAKRKATCYSCGKKGYQEDFIKEEIDEEHSIYFCSEHCKNATSEEELIKEKIYLLYQSIIGTKTLNKTVKGFLRNRLDDEYKDKKNILFSILSEKKEKISRIIAEKTFSNGIARAKYILKCVESDVNKEFERQQNKNKEMIKEIEFNFLNKRKKIKIRDISSWF